MCMTLNAETATAIASVSVAIAVAIITWRQWITNRDTLKHQLFDRRYAIYEQIAGFLAEIAQTGTIRLGGDIDFLQKTKQAYFVFSCDPDVKDLLSQIYTHAIDFHALEAELSSESGTARHENIEKQRAIKNWFSETHKDLEKRFEKFLRLDH